ncbi:hypothetical protein PV04_05409 [Phialophora macrospora]|uniref:Transcription factor domain-containing protein n=1 Tax=Phialophora macrospora TaxID=1851006 RepID=A0A0D2CWK7_9EURO|nr:hypothetical protein PV04_05409 [Phialophora macrospora]
MTTFFNNTFPEGKRHCFSGSPQSAEVDQATSALWPSRFKISDNARSAYVKDLPHSSKLKKLQAYIGTSALVPAKIPHSTRRASGVADPDAQALKLIDDAALTLEVGFEMRQFLVDNFFTFLNPVLPVFDNSTDIAGEALGLDRSSSASAEFRKQMVYAISCHCVPVHASKFALLSKACRNRAQMHLPEATASITVETLRNVILLAILALFEPTAINFGQTLSLAGRLCLDLDILNIDHGMFRRLYMVVLCMERQVSATLDRPFFLPALDRTKSDRTKNRDKLDSIEILSFLTTFQTCWPAASEDESTSALLLADFKEVRNIVLHTTSPNAQLLASLRQAEFLRDPSSASHAASLISAVADPHYFHTFMTPWWIFRALQTIAGNGQGRGASEILSPEYHQGLRMLESDAYRWPSCRALADMLT